MSTSPRTSNGPAPKTDSFSGRGIVLLSIDRATGAVTVIWSNKQVTTLPMNFPFHPDSAISNISYSPQLNLLHLRTIRGDDIVVELPRFGGSFAPIDGRPVVYLDQKDWSSLAKAVYAPERVVPPAERKAAEQLISLARSKKVILPISAGHMSETCRWTNDDERYQLALTMVQLSAGWQMRDPLDLRRFEIQKVLAERFKDTQLAAPAVFTLEPNVIHGASRSTRPPLQRSGFPPDVNFAIEALTSMQGTIDTMLDAQPIAITPTPAWVARFQGFTDWLSGQTLGPERKRQSIDLFFLEDSLKEIAEAVALTGISSDERRTWIQVHSSGDIKAMPAMGLFREVLHQKHLNPGTRWEDNDLTDVMYLTCAAAYADYAVGENSLVSQVEQALKRLGRPINIYRRLRDLVPVLDGL